MSYKLTLTESERAVLESVRATLGLRSWAAVIRHWIKLAEPTATIFGVPVVANPAIPDGEAHLVTRDGRRYKVTGLGAPLRPLDADLQAELGHHGPKDRDRK